ncbi:putative feruloyl esterase b protein [Neofusicoccum parvum]|uniref:Carboxylic ester hydrolase n=2 Tax=Neofusicoccum parvum TaxID=310453 RepID=R1E6Z1_BOTPV|nr:putative feruloyl esterase b protein [Neofusicoccum parvum UCRNP2]GME28476.1 putative feruloyl esterase b protein [Neofusicoccum parvum]GME32737.1 putative feruloyl esterase b protein [Neofusicoccum parvum]
MRLPSLTDAAAWTTVLAAAASAQNSSFAQECSALSSALSSVVPNATVWFSEFVTGGTNITFPDNDASCARPAQVVENDMCRVALRVPTTNRSEISMEAWLPSNWTGRFLSTGNGGTSGCIQYEDMAYASDLGFATVGANNGHNGTRGIAFGQNEDVVLDFAWRSMHTGVVVGKHISETFYGKTHTKSYYLGCSTGGRQGFKSAQAFADDFDGIVAGAPALSFNNLTSWSGHFYTIFGGNDTERFVPTDMWPIIHEDILKQCDGIDGAVDGIIEDPELCQYRPEALICASNATDTSSCLTGPQADAVRLVFSGVYGEDGMIVYPRMQPGSEIIASHVMYTGSDFIYTTDWYRYAIYNDPTWDPLTLSPADMAYAAAKNPGNIQTWDDLTAFQARGGKLLHYHGQMDAIISSDNSPRYYNHVSRQMNLNSAELDDFYRFFRISGMGHCSGGDGAWMIGNQLESRASLDPDHNALMAMVRWVEQGVAPDKLIGTKFVNDTESLGVDFTRVHCKYPKRNVYTGTGDGKDTEGWTCV